MTLCTIEGYDDVIGFGFFFLSFLMVRQRLWLLPLSSALFRWFNHFVPMFIHHFVYILRLNFVVWFIGID